MNKKSEEDSKENKNQSILSSSTSSVSTTSMDFSLPLSKQQETKNEQKKK